MAVKIYHNPGCSKSRQTLQLLHDHGIEPEIINYLTAPPSTAELDRILKQLDRDPRTIMRRKEGVYRDLNLDDPTLGRAALIRALVENPILIERPIVVTDCKAALGRPPEDVLAIL